MDNRFAGSSGHQFQLPNGTYQESAPVLMLFNGAYIMPNSTHEGTRWESDAQIAARKAMAKRNSRSFSARVTRAKSRKRDRLTKPAKPTIDTSFTRHNGDIPRQVFPQEHNIKNGGLSRKNTFLGLGRSGTRSKGLGIMKGTPQPEVQSQPFGSNQEPKTADTLSPGTRAWTEISPSDRPIPIGISIPSDSLPDFSPYQTNRQRSESDATLVTPSIIITPAVAMKSVWSPDTESEYTPSIYSRATFNPYTNSQVPPVPALPTNIAQTSSEKGIPETYRTVGQPAVTRTRNNTLDSAGTAFEEEDSPVKSKERITSTATVFEEDEVPLRPKNLQPTGLTIDTTSAIPTPRRSQGWWNFITTPFEFSRANSVWTQNGRNNDRAPDIPMMPQQFTRTTDSPSTPSTYIWSATEKSPSVAATSPAVPGGLSFVFKDNMTTDTSQHGQDAKMGTTTSFVGQAEPNDDASKPIERVHQDIRHLPQQTASTDERNMTSPLSALSASPIVGTAAIGTVLTPRQVQEQQPAKAVVDLQIKHPDANAHAFNDRSPQNMQSEHEQPKGLGLPIASISKPKAVPSQGVPYFPPPPERSRQDSPQQVSAYVPSVTTYRDSSAYTSQPEFLPPPRVAHASQRTGNDYNSRSSSPVSSSELKTQHQKKHRKVFNIMKWLPLGRRNQKDHQQGKKKSRSKRLCWGCCCCLLILILLAIIIPVVVVVSRKDNGDSKSQDPPSQWLNLTGYPPMPTGISTIAQPEAVEAQSGCVIPATIWSCAIPKEDQKADSPNKPDQPNLKLEITFQNGTVSDPSKTKPTRRASNPVSAGAFIRSRFLNTRAVPSASPTVPGSEDYTFLGNTTDGNQAPFEGEDTPFFISMLDPDESKSSRLAKRAGEGSTNLTTGIPDPELQSDGTAAPANLFPSASNQPLRLFNRGKEDEHYGFFVYYNRSIFLKDVSQNFSAGGNPADVNGGSPRDAATMRFTWAETRFLVQIWTRSQSSKTMLRSSTEPNSNDPLRRPGTFPYPVTVTIDRHGSRATKKMLYRYDMEKDGTIVNNDKKKSFHFEDRKFGGTLVNPSQGLERNVPGVVDGGTGGCSCKWQNWGV